MLFLLVATKLRKAYKKTKNAQFIKISLGKSGIYFINC